MHATAGVSVASGICAGASRSPPWQHAYVADKALAVMRRVMQGEGSCRHMHNLSQALKL